MRPPRTHKASLKQIALIDVQLIPRKSVITPPLIQQLREERLAQGLTSEEVAAFISIG